MLESRNICGVRILFAGNLNVKDLLECEAVLTTERTVTLLNHRFNPANKAAKAVAGDKSEAAAESKKKAAKAPAKASAAEPKKTTKAKSAGKAADAAPAKTTRAKKKSEE